MAGGGEGRWGFVCLNQSLPVDFSQPILKLSDNPAQSILQQAAEKPPVSSTLKSAVRSVAVHLNEFCWKRSGTHGLTLGCLRV